MHSRTVTAGACAARPLVKATSSGAAFLYTAAAFIGGFSWCERDSDAMQCRSRPPSLETRCREFEGMTWESESDGVTSVRH